jgi:hypothetical protein
MRRITRRIALDKKRGARQCMSPRGKGSIRFCLLGDGHDGLHANGGLEWGSGHRTPVGDLYAEVLSKRAG